MANKRMTTPTQKANIAASVIISLIVVLMGVLMLLSGLEVINVDIGIFWLPTLLFALSAVGLTLGILRKEILPLWLGLILVVCGLTVVIHLTAGTEYARLYPMFIAAPAAASAIVVLFADNKKLHFQSMILFGGLTAIFLLESLAKLNGWIVAGIAVVMVGLFFFISAVTSRRGRWDDGDRPQRPRGKKWDDGDRPQGAVQEERNKDEN